MSKGKEVKYTPLSGCVQPHCCVFFLFFFNGICVDEASACPFRMSGCVAVEVSSKNGTIRYLQHAGPFFRAHRVEINRAFLLSSATRNFSRFAAPHSFLLRSSFLHSALLSSFPLVLLENGNGTFKQVQIKKKKGSSFPFFPLETSSSVVP